NNHGTYYDAQVASLALFTGQRELAAEVLGESRRKRIAAQVDPDGRQPRELGRTRAWSYSVMNLGGLVSLAALADRAGVDLWHYETSDGRSIRKALDWLVPFARGRKWPHPQITAWSPKDLAPLLREGGVAYRDLWTMPVVVERLDLRTFAGGLKPVRRVGGQETKGLAIRGADGRDYTFRAVDKDPGGVLPADLRDTIAERIVRDQIAAS